MKVTYTISGTPCGVPAAVVEASIAKVADRVEVDLSIDGHEYASALTVDEVRAALRLRGGRWTKHAGRIAAKVKGAIQ